MKKIIIKTILITLGVALILAISVFGIMSFCTPAAMMALTESLGLDNISGDYAYQEYQRSGDISYLARSFEIAAENQKDAAADERFDEFYAHEDFASYCAEQDETASSSLPAISYRDYVCGAGACVKYRLSGTDETKQTVYEFAVSETDVSFPNGNPVLELSVEAAGADDVTFCTYIYETISVEGFEENGYYLSVISILENVIEETGNE